MPKTQAQRNWIEKNKEYYNELQNIYTKKHYLKNRDAKLEYARQYREQNKDTILQKQREKYHQKKSLKENESSQNI